MRTKRKCQICHGPLEVNKQISTCMNPKCRQTYETRVILDDRN